MISPTIPAVPEAGKMCFSFWFAAFGAGDTTSLKIYKYDSKDVDRMDENYDDFNRCHTYVGSDR